MTGSSLVAAAMLLLAAGGTPADGGSDCYGALARLGTQLEQLGGTLAAAGPIHPERRLVDAEYASLSKQFGSQIDAIQADKPVVRLIGPAANLLLSDARDGLILMRTASHPAARHVGLLKVAHDLKLLASAAGQLTCPSRGTTGRESTALTQLRPPGA